MIERQIIIVFFHSYNPRPITYAPISRFLTNDYAYNLRKIHLNVKQQSLIDIEHFRPSNETFH